MGTATAFERVDWYDDPESYDILLEEDTDVEARFLHELLERTFGPGPRDVLEPACGSGRLLEALAERGHRPMGIDLSQPMLDYAADRLAARGLSADLAHVSMESFRTRRRFDLAFCLVSSFRYLASERAARTHLQSVARALRTGGLYVLGLHLTQYDWPGIQRERWVGERAGTRVVCNLQSWPPDPKRRLEKLRSRVTIERRGTRQRMETHWSFRTYDAAQLKRLLRSVPALEHVETYDFGYELDTPRELDDEQLDCVLILRKRRGTG